MAQNPTSKNDSFAYVQGTSNITLTGRDAELAIRLGTTSLPATTDTSLADTNALFAVRNTALDFAWRLSTKSSIALGETGTVGCGFFLMRDNTDAGGEGTSRVKYYDLSAEASRTFPNSGTYVSQASGTGTILAADLVQPGTYKVIAVMYEVDGQTESDTTPPKLSLANVSNGAEFYVDSDGYVGASTGLTATPALNVFGIGRVGRIRVAADVQSITTSVSPAQGYTDQPTIAFALSAGTVNNPKSARAAVSLKTNGATASSVKELNVTYNNAGFGVTSSPYNVDTQFTQSNATYRPRVYVGPTGNQSSTLAGETPDLLSSGTLVLANANDKAWICFTAGSGTALVSSNQLAIEGTTDFTAGYDVQINTKSITSQGGATLYNRGETFTADFTFKDVNGRSITALGTVTVRAENTANGVEGSSTDATSPYTISYAIGTSDTATFDLVGSQKHLNVIFAAYGSNNPTIDYPTGLGLTHLVSREWQFSTVSGSINGNIFTGKAASPASDTTLVRNHGQALFFNCFVFNARGELLGSPTSKFYVRRLIDETEDMTAVALALASGQLTGSSATYIPTSSDLLGGKTLVVTNNTAAGSQPRTGTGGSGNFAETSISNWTTPDSSGNNRTGTVNGPTDMFGPPVLLTTGGGMFFDGVLRPGGLNNTSSIDTGYSTTIPATGFCVECRFIPTSNVADCLLVGKNSNFLSSVWLGTDTALDRLRGKFGTSGSDVVITGTTTLTVGTPYAAAIDYDGTTARLWLKRGSVAASLEGSAVMTFQDRVTNSLVIGADIINAVTPFEGYIDEVRVSNISRYPSAFDPGTVPFTADANTLLLYHLDTVNQGGEFALSKSGKMTPHLQLGAVPLDPSLNVASRPVTTLGQISAKVTDASGDGYNGAVGDISLRDDADARPVQLDSAQTTATLNGFAGYIPLKDWDSGIPVGGWDEWASANFIKDGNVFIMPRKEAASYDFTLTSPAGTSKKVIYLFDD